MIGRTPFIFFDRCLDARYSAVALVMPSRVIICAALPDPRPRRRAGAPAPAGRSPHRPMADLPGPIDGFGPDLRVFVRPRPRLREATLRGSKISPGVTRAGLVDEGQGKSVLGTPRTAAPAWLADPM